MGSPRPPSSTVVSRDGTTIAYRAWGDGPGVVLLHGAMQSSGSFTKLSEILASSFSVYVPDRRGRGGSGPPGPAYGLARELEDLEALLRETGARYLFGLSSGAIIALHAALHLPEVSKVAAYEPPVSLDGVNPGAWVPRYEKHLQRAELARAMVSALQGTTDLGFFAHAPRALLVPLIAVALRAEARKAASGAVLVKDLVPTIRFDTQLQREGSAEVDAFTGIRAKLLLLGGDRSHPALQLSLQALARRLGQASVVVLPGLGHTAAHDKGRPEDVARELRAFFQSA